MRNGLKFVPAVAKLLLLSLLAMPLTTVAVFPAEQPTVSNKLAKPLKAAQDAMAAKKLDEAMAKIKEAQAVPREDRVRQLGHQHLPAQGLCRQAGHGQRGPDHREPGPVPVHDT